MPPDRAAATPPAETTLEGIVERVTFYNPTNGFSVVRVRVRGRREPIAVVGTLPAAPAGRSRGRCGGVWQTDPRHGAQFRPTSAEVRRPSDVDGIVRYLGSGLVKQIGPVLAKRIVGTFGERTLDVLDATPERVREVPGIGPQRARAIAAAWAEHRALRDLMAFLAEHGLDGRFAPRLLAAYGTDATRILAANPYRLVADVPGLGFPSADRLGQRSGHPSRPPRPASRRRSRRRCSAPAENGHTRLPRRPSPTRPPGSPRSHAELAESGVAQLLAGGTIAVRSAPRTDAPRSEAPAPIGHAARRARSRSSGTRPGCASTHRRARPRTRRRSVGGGAPPARRASGIGLAGLVRAEEDLAAPAARAGQATGPASAQRSAPGSPPTPSRAGLSDEQRAGRRHGRDERLLRADGRARRRQDDHDPARWCAASRRSGGRSRWRRRPARRPGGSARWSGWRRGRSIACSGPARAASATAPNDPLPFDVVIVDEASMLDTQLARAVVRAVGPGQPADPGRGRRSASQRRAGPGAARPARQRAGALGAPGDGLSAGRLSQIVTNAHRIRQGLLRTWRRRSRSAWMRASVRADGLGLRLRDGAGGARRDRRRRLGRRCGCRACSASRRRGPGDRAAGPGLPDAEQSACRSGSTRRAASPSVPTARCRCGLATA